MKDKNHQLVYEDQTTTFNQQRTFMGLNVNHCFFFKNLKIGITILNYFENPNNQKVPYRSESVDNTIFRLNSTYGGTLPFLTRWISISFPSSRHNGPIPNQGQVRGCLFQSWHSPRYLWVDLILITSTAIKRGSL